jgi:replicative DNA helicase
MKNIELASIALAVEYPEISHVLLRNADEKLWIGEEARAAFGVLSKLYEDGETVTWPLVFDLFAAAGVKQASIDGMVSCLAGIPDGSEEKILRKYVEKLKVNKAKREALREIAKQAQGPVFSLDAVKEIIEAAEMNSVNDESPELGVAYDEYVSWITDEKSGVGTGFPSFDKLTDSLNFGELAAIMGRTRTGKTWVGINVMVSVALQNPKLKIGFFSMEMPKAAIAERMLQIEYNKSRWEIKPDVKVDPKGFKNIFTGRFPNVLIFGGIYGVDELKALIRKHELQVVFIDFLGLVKPRNGDGSLYQQATQKMVEIKQAAKDTRSLIFLLIQLSRTAGYGNLPVTIDMARDSGAIEEMSDMIYGVWDPGLDPARASEWQDRLAMALLKNKRGGCRELRVHFNKRTGKMIEEENAY